MLDRLAQQHPDSPREQLLGLAVFIVDDLERAGYRGCPFTNTLAEIPEADHPARALIQAHKKRQFERVKLLCTQLKASKPGELAEELTLLMEGAQVVAQNKGVDQVGERLMRMVRERL